MVNHFEVIAQIVDLFIVTPDYWLKYNSGVTEMLRNYKQAGKLRLTNLDFLDSPFFIYEK